jgi:hypothetical protein
MEGAAPAILFLELKRVLVMCMKAIAKFFELKIHNPEIPGETLIRRRMINYSHPASHAKSPTIKL